MAESNSGIVLRQAGQSLLRAGSRFTAKGGAVGGLYEIWISYLVDEGRCIFTDS